MAAHAVDVTLSGHVNRAIFITDSDGDSSTSGSVKDNASSGTRIRVKGSGEMMDGASAGVLLEYGAGSSLSLRYADVWFAGGFGKVSIGHGDQGGEGSVYNDKSGVLGIGHGQDNAGVTATTSFTTAAEAAKEMATIPTKGARANYYTSLDAGGGRNERIRYDTPSVGPFSAAVSVGNGDQVSAGIKVSQDFGGTTFSAGVGTIQWGGTDKSTISGSAGVKLPSGVTISGAWGRGSNHEGMHMPLVKGSEPVKVDYDWVLTDYYPANDSAETAKLTLYKSHILVDDVDTAVLTWETERPDDANDFLTTDTNVLTGEEIGGSTITIATDGTFAPFAFDEKVAELHGLIEAGMESGASPEAMQMARQAEMELNFIFDVFKCAEPSLAEKKGEADTATLGCNERLYAAAVKRGVDTPAMDNTTDPSFFQTTIGYVFGDTSVGVSFYRSSDKVNTGSSLTAVGIGANHNLPKIGANVYAAAQNYSVEDGDMESDDTVVMIGARIKF